jgi:hypothetical protein
VQRHLAEDNAGNAVIALGTGQSIALLGVAASSLTGSNFVFDQTPVLNNPGTVTIGDGALLPSTTREPSRSIRPEAKRICNSSNVG